QDGIVLEEIEAGAGDLAAGFEVNQIQGLAQLDVILDREVECAWAPHSAKLPAVALGSPDGCIRMSQVRDPPQALADPVLDHAKMHSLPPRLGLEAFALLDERGPPFRILLPAGRLGHLVLTAADLLDGRKQQLALALQ